MLRVVLGLIGFTATIAQILLLRELLVVFSGNEISLGVVLASWLIWIAVGCAFLARAVLRVSNMRRTLAILQLSAAIILPGTIIVTRLLRVVLGISPAETLGPGSMFISSFLILSLFCSISGITFAVGSRLYSQLRR